MKEFGIRIALGASPPNLARAVFGELWWMSAIGIAVGVVTSIVAVDFLDAAYRNPLMTSRLVSLPVTQTIAAAATLVVITVAGMAMPLRRVLTMDVMRTVQGSG
ncbi:MAG: FtsX-like permease family protein [Gemmatimonadota bacterium]